MLWFPLFIAWMLWQFGTQWFRTPIFVWIWCASLIPFVIEQALIVTGAAHPPPGTVAVEFDATPEQAAALKTAIEAWHNPHTR